MNKEIKPIFNLLFISGLLIFFSSCEGETDYAFNDYDVNGDEQLDRTEFETAFTGDREYFDDWDGDRNGEMDENEWREGVSTYYSEYNYDEDGEFSNWDANGDKVIDDDEFLEGSFGLWDTNDDNHIDEDEYDEWNFDEQYQEEV